MNNPYPVNALNEFGRGMALPFRAVAELVRHPHCLLYLAIPFLLSLLFYLAGAVVFFYYAMPWLEGMLPAADGRWTSILQTGAVWIIRLGAVLLVLTLFVFTFTAVFLFVAAPFADQLAVTCERELYGLEFKYRGWRDFCRCNWVSAVNSVRIGMKILLWSCLLWPVSLLLPGPGFLLPAAVIGYYFGVGMLIYANEHRRIPYREFMDGLRGSRTAITGMGIVFYLLMLLPFGAVFCLPVAVVAGTMLYHEMHGRPTVS